MKCTEPVRPGRSVCLSVGPPFSPPVPRENWPGEQERPRPRPREGQVGYLAGVMIWLP